MKQRPTPEEAQEAQHNLEEAILGFSDEARLPELRGTPNPDPTWKPRPSTLRYSYLRGGGWAWTMDADDPQIVAYYIVPSSGETFGKVTAHGHDRHNFQVALKERRIYPTYVPWVEWFDYNERYQMDQKTPRRY